MDSLLKCLWTLLNKTLYYTVVEIFHLKISDSTWKKLMQFVKFGIVGLSNTLISYVIYVGTLLLLQTRHLFPEADYLIAQLAGFIISVAWSFYWNRKYVFSTDNKSTPWFQALIKTYISYAFTGLLLNSFLSMIWIEILGVSKLAAPILNLLITVPSNFFINKFWTFRK